MVCERMQSQLTSGCECECANPLDSPQKEKSIIILAGLQISLNMFRLWQNMKTKLNFTYEVFARINFPKNLAVISINKKAHLGKVYLDRSKTTT